MNVKAISFSGIYNTREIANIVAGKEYANAQFLSSLTGIPKGKLLSTYSSDVFSASSNYCANKMAEINPKLKPIRKTALEIKALMHPDGIENADMKKIRKLMEKRENAIDTFCKKQGETIEIPEFPIPFLHN